MIGLIETFIDRTTMYRLVLYWLVALVAVAFALSPFHLVPFEPLQLVASTAIIVLASGITNWILCKLYDTPANTDSVWITALILVLILNPVELTDWAGMLAIAVASIWAISSKFILAISRKHIFNPAALGIALAALVLDRPGTWWIANPWLLPVVSIGGLMILRKLQRFDLVILMLLANIAVVLVTVRPPLWQSSLTELLIHSPLLFVGFAMLTEPLTTPPQRWARWAYAIIVGVLMAPSIKLFDTFVTPELALLAGNLFAFLVSPKRRYEMTLLRIEEIAAGTFDFVFRPDRKLAYAPGQYLEWTLATPRADSRGNRRSFTVASAPGENEVRLGARVYDKSSTFKRALSAMQPGDRIFASHLSGNFTLPRNPATKLAFIAGGIGITPFRSMIGHLMANGERRDITLFYGNLSPAEIAYRPLLETARDTIGLRIIYAVDRDAETGMRTGIITTDMIRTDLPDYRERLFYLSGPRPMVLACRRLLRNLGVPRSHIREDFFPGLA